MNSSLPFSDFPGDLQKRLEKKSDPGTRDWWQGYVKNSAPFLGVKMAEIRKAVHAWHQSLELGTLPAEQEIELALALISRCYSEEKLAGILYLQEILLPAGMLSCVQMASSFADLFIQNAIYDWNVCDWFCVKVLGPMIDREGDTCAAAIQDWHKSPNLWQARASLVAFVPVAGRREYYPGIDEACRVLIRRPERFAKTAVGWILRDISRHDHRFVKKLVSENIDHFTRESAQNALKYFEKDEKQELLKGLKGRGADPSAR